MASRWFNVAVVLLWLATMGWLVTTKILPSVLIGEAPNYQTILSAQRVEPSIGWKLDWNDRRLGWAVSKTSSLPYGLTEIRSRVHFDELPLGEMIPEDFQGFLPSLDQIGSQLQMEAHSLLNFDPLGRLSGFESSVVFPTEEAIKMKGTIDGAKMSVEIHYGDLPPVNKELPLPRNAMLADALSPQSRLPGLRDGQHWTIETYNPLRPATSPNEILYASVEGSVPMLWDGLTVDAWLVVFRNDPGASLGGANSPRGKMWVRRDGTVLKQQLMFFNSTLTFTRLSEAEATNLGDAIEPRDTFGNRLRGSVKKPPTRPSTTGRFEAVKRFGNRLLEAVSKNHQGGHPRPNDGNDPVQ